MANIRFGCKNCAFVVCTTTEGDSGISGSAAPPFKVHESQGSLIETVREWLRDPKGRLVLSVVKRG